MYGQETEQHKVESRPTFLLLVLSDISAISAMAAVSFISFGWISTVQQATALYTGAETDTTPGIKLGHVSGLVYMYGCAIRSNLQSLMLWQLRHDGESEAREDGTFWDRTASIIP